MTQPSVQYAGFRPAQPGWNVQRVSNNISPEEFFSRFVYTRTPVIITGLLADKTFDARDWSPSAIDKVAGNASVGIEHRDDSTGTFGTGRKFPQTLSSFLRAHGQPGLYLTTQALAEDGDGVPMELFAEPLKRMIGKFPVRPSICGNLAVSSINLWMGRSLPAASTADALGVGSGAGAAVTSTGQAGPATGTSTTWIQDLTHGQSSNLHHDFHDNLYVLLRGRKVFTIAAPSNVGNMYTHGQVSRVHANGLINYKGCDTRPDTLLEGMTGGDDDDEDSDEDMDDGDDDFDGLGEEDDYDNEDDDEDEHEEEDDYAGPSTARPAAKGKGKGKAAGAGSKRSREQALLELLEQDEDNDDDGDILVDTSTLPSSGRGTQAKAAGASKGSSSKTAKASGAKASKPQPPAASKATAKTTAKDNGKSELDMLFERFGGAGPSAKGTAAAGGGSSAKTSSAKASAAATAAAKGRKASTAISNDDDDDEEGTAEQADDMWAALLGSKGMAKAKGQGAGGKANAKATAAASASAPAPSALENPIPNHFSRVPLPRLRAEALTRLNGGTAGAGAAGVNTGSSSGAAAPSSKTAGKPKTSLGSGPVTVTMLLESIQTASKVRNTFPNFSKAVFTTFELQAGEMLYLPAGWFHEVVSLGSTAGGAAAATANDASGAAAGGPRAGASKRNAKTAGSNDLNSDPDLHVALNYWFYPPTRTVGPAGVGNNYVSSSQAVGSMSSTSSARHVVVLDSAAGLVGHSHDIESLEPSAGSSSAANGRGRGKGKGKAGASLQAVTAHHRDFSTHVHQQEAGEGAALHHGAAATAAATGKGASSKHVVVKDSAAAVTGHSHDIEVLSPTPGPLGLPSDASRHQGKGKGKGKGAQAVAAHHHDFSVHVHQQEAGEGAALHRTSSSGAGATHSWSSATAVTAGHAAVLAAFKQPYDDNGPAQLFARALKAHPRLKA